MLQPFDLEIQYVAGRSNFVTDMLFRISEQDQVTPGEKSEPDMDVCAVALDFPRCSAMGTREEQLNDPKLKLIM